MNEYYHGKIRFYHWWVYRLFHWMWNPIFRTNPGILDKFEKGVLQWKHYHLGLKASDSAGAPHE